MFPFWEKTTCQNGIELFPPETSLLRDPGFAASALQCLVDKCYTEEYKPLETCPVAWYYRRAISAIRGRLPAQRRA